MVKTLSIKKLFIFFFLFFVSNQGFTQAPLKVFCPVIADASIDQNKTNPQGNASDLVCYPWAKGFKKRFLVKFDLSIIPPGAKIISAKIQLRTSNFSGVGKTPISVHKVTKKWSESSVTWTDISNNFEKVKTSIRNIKWNSSSKRENWNVAKDVISILNGTSANYGWIFKEKNMKKNNSWSFYSKENGLSFKPKLIIIYELSSTSPLNISKTQKNITCKNSNNGQASVTVSGGKNNGYIYNWIPKPTVGQGTNTASSLTPGIWKLKVEDALDNTIFKTISFVITEPTPVEFKTKSSNLTCKNCNNGTLTLNASGGVSPYQFSLDNGLQFQTKNIFENLALGSFNLIVKDANGCFSQPEVKSITLASKPNTVFLSPLGDASISAHQTHRNHGSLTYMESHPWGSSYSKRFLLQFDLSSIPIGATITSAKIKLTVSSNHGFQRTINTYLANSAWDESTVTWNNFNNQFNGVASSSKTLNSSVGSIVEWSVKADIQGMIDGNIINNGWLFMDTKESDWSQQYWYFYTKESKTKAPQLEITYTVPAPNIITSTIYYQLQPKLQADYAYAETNKVFFLFDTPYTLAPNTRLNFKIYNSKRVLIFDQNSVNIPVKYGLNKLNIDVTTLVNGIYVLEVINSIGETQFLTFVK